MVKPMVFVSKKKKCNTTQCQSYGQRANLDGIFIYANNDHRNNIIKLFSVEIAGVHDNMWKWMIWIWAVYILSAKTTMTKCNGTDVNQIANQ